MTTVRLGYIDLSFHHASAAVVASLLEQAGVAVQMSAAPHEQMFARYRRGEIDMLVSAWLPASHGGYLAPSLEKTLKLGVLYHPYCIWGVPDYVPASAVASVEDLLKPEVAERMSPLIQGINPGAGISRFSTAMMTEYGLAQAGYHFNTGTEADCFVRFEQGYANNEWLVVPLWHPQFLHFSHNIRALEEPKGLLGGQDQATLIVTHDMADQLPQPLLTSLSDLKLGNQAVSELDHSICRQGLTPRQAARQWLAKARL
ncbi:glycine betaine ABC transporter substrate-binding protein [Gallaecimonas pentaromativorans]|uniref:glycine betaine ABC transporter substrate-binding protein n=1 Tax=Gallaecimonas pentaromativorans TaxID=584787 RepID=UPI003A94CBD1